MIALLPGRVIKRRLRFGIASFAHLYLCCSMAAHSVERASMPILPRHSVLGAAVSDTGSGLKILNIAAGSPAEQAGLQVGDIVSDMGHEPVRTPLEFTLHVRRSPANTPISFQVLRAGRSLLLPVVLAVAPDESDPKVLTEYRAVRVDDTLRRTLITLPVDHPERLPAVLIAGGIGCYSVDVATDRQDSYLRLAHDLSDRGFAVMRIEKSGVGDSEGPPCPSVDFESEIRGYAAALASLREDPRVNPARVYLFGHSIGSAIVPRLAAKQPVAGVIVAEAFGRNWIEYELWNLRRQLVLGGDAPNVVDAALAEKEICIHRLLIGREAESDIEKTLPACKLHDAYPAAASYMQQVAALNIAEAWTKVAVPTLAIYGTGDFVTTEADHRRIVDIVNATYAGAASLVLIPGMDHHLDVAGTPQQAYDLRVKGHGSGPYEPRMSATVLDWLCLRERCHAG